MYQYKKGDIMSDNRKGGYQMIDLSGIHFVTDEAGTIITDEEIRSKVKEVINSGKPILVYGFRPNHGPNFGKVYNGNGSAEIFVSTSIDIPNNTFWAYSVVWMKETDVITAYCKQYTLS